MYRTVKYLYTNIFDRWNIG